MRGFPFVLIKPTPLLRLERFYSNNEETLGLFFLRKTFQCFSLEDQHQTVKVFGETRIPSGLYLLTLENSPKFSVPERYGHPMLTINDVPNFTGIRIHAGINDKHTDGCPLTGTYPVKSPETGRVTLVYHKEAYKFLYANTAPIVGKEKSYIEIIDRD